MSKPHSNDEPEATTYFQLQRNRDGLPDPGESEISRTDLKRSGVRSVPLISVRQMQRLLRYLIDRGHVERAGNRDLIRPVRADEMPLR